jgi:hypothetical protein
MAAPILLAVWAVVNMAVTYLPLAFQRKLLMGEHLPVAILAGLGIAHVLRPLGRRAWTAGIVVATMLLGLTNVSFMWRDVSNFLRNRGQSLIHRPYMYDGEVATVEWLAAHTPRGTTIQPLPWIVETADRKVAFFDTTLACFTPGLTGRPVNAGHWGETPDFASTMGQWVRFQLPWVSDEWREDLLRRTGVRYIVFTQMHDEINDAAQNARLLALFRENRVPPFLRRIRWASNVDATAYEVVLPAR